MTIRNLVLTCFLLLLLSACAPIPPRMNAVPSERVGVAILLDSHPKHVHVGTTIFNNHEYSLPNVDWHVKRHVMATVRKELAAKPGYTVKEIDGSELWPFRDNIVSSQGWNSLVIRKSVVPALEQIAKDDDIDALLVVTPEAGQVVYNASYSTSGYGLYTYCFLVICTAGDLSEVTADVIALNPPKLVGWPTSSTWTGYKRLSFFPHYKVGQDWSEVSPKDVARVKPTVFQAIDSNIHSALVNSGLE